MKLFSEACDYAIRAVVWLAQQTPRPYKVREIADGIQAAPGYLIKVLQTLAKADILSAQRGSRGGFTLENDPARLTVLQVINAIDPVERITTCPMGLKSHGKRLCWMHQKIDDAMATIEDSFRTTTIAELLNQPSRPKPMCEVSVGQT